LQQFELVIEAVVAAARSHQQARTAVEGAFEQLERGGWHIEEPVRRIWAGERDEERLLAGLDDADALIVREILRFLKQKE
jgi:hypothetical protein